MILEIIGFLLVGVGIVMLGIKIIPPTHRGVIERLGKYNRFANTGFNFVIPLIERISIGPMARIYH